MSEHSKNFINAINTADAEYRNHLSKLANKEAYNIYQINDYAARLEAWKRFAEANKENPEVFEQVANPFFVGYGNPSSHILIIGKEKGFDYCAEDYIQFFNESFNNTYYWQQIEFQKNLSRVDKLNFNTPRLPYNGSINGQTPGHTWNWYNKLIKNYYPDFNPGTESFLERCFITEMNHVPSRRSRGRSPVLNRESYPLRINFLAHPFYKKFKVIINTARAYDTTNLNEKLFDVEYLTTEQLGENRRMKTLFYKNQDYSLAMTSQLSGSNTYISNSGLQMMIDKLKLI